MRCTEPKLMTIAVAALAAASLSACGSGDSTASKTPDPTAPAAAKKSAAPTVVAGPKTTAAPADPCAVSLTAPDIAKAVSTLPADPRSKQG